MTNFAHRAFDRRDFLRLMGLGTGAFFLPSLAGRSTARAQPMAPPRRLLVIYANASWTTRVGDLAMRPPWGPVDDYALYDFQRNRIVPDPNSWTFDFTDPRLEEAQMSRVLAPFWRHRRKMTAIEGLGLLSAGLDPFGDGHAKAHAHGLTGAPAAYDFDGVKSWASQPSIDQRVHEHLLRTEPSLVSLDFRAWQDRAGPAMFHEMLYRSDPAGGVTRVTPETNPEVAFARLFEGRGPAVDGRDQAQSQVLDLVRAQHDRLIGRVGAEDRLKLEAHRQLVADLQTRLQGPMACGLPVAPGAVDGLDRTALYAHDVDAFARMVTLGFACGVSRVGSLGLVYAPTEAYGLPPDTAIHHDYEHHIYLEEFFRPEGPTEDNRHAYEKMRDRNVYQSELVARIIDHLDAVPEGDGTLLDNTLVVYWSELSHGNHGLEDTFFVLFGGGGGAIRPGRYLKYARNNPNPFGRNYNNEYTNTPHSHLLVSLAQAFGEPIDFIPGAESCIGSVPHGGVENVRISLAGPLPGLA
jgi:hypothetical protein